MSVESHLKQRHLEKAEPRVSSRVTRQLTSAQQEIIENGVRIVNIATNFLETTGIRLALFEFNQDLLDNKGRVSLDKGAHYIENGGGAKSLPYFSRLTLKWESPEEKFYSLTVGVKGDLLDEFETDKEGRDHRRSLSIVLLQSGNPTDEGAQVGPRIVFGNYFDIYDPGATNSADAIENLEEEEIGQYMALEEKEGTEDLGRNTLKDWVEANIAGFVAYLQREQHQDPLCLPLLDN